MRPLAGEEFVIGRQALGFGDAVNVFTIGVKFRQPLGAGVVDAIRQLAIVTLKSTIPVEKILERRYPPEARQGRAHADGIAQIGACVASRARLQSWPIAIDKNMRGGGL